MSRIIRNADDVCAIIIVLGCIVLIATGIDGEIKAILGVAAGFLFGKHRTEIASKVVAPKS